MFDEAERHEMELIEKHKDGRDEWLCPTCRRRFIMQWPPNFKRVILEEGDVNAIHIGGKSGVRMEASATLAEEAEGAEDCTLSDYMRDALNDLDWGD